MVGKFYSADDDVPPLHENKFVNSTTDNQNKSNFWEYVFLPLSLALIVFTFYSASLGHTFVYNDFPELVFNPQLGEWRNFFLHPVAPHYQPFSQSVFALLATTIGWEPFVFKLINITLHALNVALVCILVSRLSHLWLGIFSSLLFAFHPINLDSVLANHLQGNLWCTLFGLSACTVICLNLREQTDRKVTLMSLGACVLLMLSLSSHSNGVFFSVFVIVLICRNGLSQQKLFRALSISLPPLSLYLMMGYYTLGTQFLEPNTSESLTDINFASKFVQSISHIGRYIDLLLFPRYSLVHYPENLLQIAIPKHLIVALLGISLAIELVRRKNPYWIWLGWFFLGIFWQSHLLTLREDLFAERFAYVASIGFCVFLCYFAGILFADKIRNICLFIVLALISLTSLFRMDCWKNNWNLWGCQINQYQQNATTQYMYARELLIRGDYESAKFHVQKSLELKPNYLHSQLALQKIMLENEDFEKALKLTEQILSQHPKNTSVLDGAAWAHFGLQQNKQAKEYFNQALLIEPTYQPSLLGQYVLSIATLDLESAEQWERQLNEITKKDSRYLYWKKFE